MKFYLGTDMPGWLRDGKYPLFVSHRRLKPYKTLPVAKAEWALDSGGFSDLSLYGSWQTTPKEYANYVRRYQKEIGLLNWASIQDWMCEPFILAKTGLTVLEHQKRTIENYLTLNNYDPETPWLPVLQGYAINDYLEHVEMYQKAGIDLQVFPVVGVGSVCRRQATDEAERIFAALSGLGISLHGFGLKIRGLVKSQHYLVSADSMAWSYAGRREAPLPGHTHRNCSHCREYTTLWRNAVLVNMKSCINRQIYLMPA